MKYIAHNMKYIAHNIKHALLCDMLYVLRKSGGFTLVETIIYIGIVGVVITSFLYFGLAIFDYQDKSYAVSEVQANARIALELISQTIRSAKDINISSSTFGIDPGVLFLTMDDESKTPTIIGLNKDNGYLQIKEGVNEPVQFTSSQIKVTDLKFFDLTGTSTIKNIKINLTIEYSNANQNEKYNYSEDLGTAVSLRR